MAKDITLKEIGETLEFIVGRMATKDDVRAIVREMIVEHVPGIVALELKPLREQLAQIEKRLDMLEEHYANLKGVTKEIDDIRSEIRAIQKHLGLDTKIAA